MAMHFTGLAGSIPDNAAKSMSEVAPELSPILPYAEFSTRKAPLSPPFWSRRRVGGHSTAMRLCPILARTIGW